MKTPPGKGDETPNVNADLAGADTGADAEVVKAKKPVSKPEGERTKPRPVDENGRPLDAWGLPLSGPARAAKLAELGKGDPHTNPEDWPSADDKQD